MTDGYDFNIVAFHTSSFKQFGHVIITSYVKRSA